MRQGGRLQTNSRSVFSLSKIHGIFTVTGLLLIVLYLGIFEPELNNKIRSEGPVTRSIVNVSYLTVSHYQLRRDDLELVVSDDVAVSKQIVVNKGLSYLLNQAKPYIKEDTMLTGITLDASHSFRGGRLVENVLCKAIFEGNEEEIARAVNLSSEATTHTLTAPQYISMTKNCTNFILHRGYITHHLTQVEKNFPLAFSILMYRDVEQSERLLRAIYRPQNLYCIHVDSKSNELIYEAMRNIAACFDNVFMTRTRFNVTWGTMTVLEPELLCMEELLSKNKTWKYFINLTGQEFPLKSNYELVLILMALNGSNVIYGFHNHTFHKRWRNAGLAPHGIKPLPGMVHVAASRKFVEFALKDNRSLDFLNWTRQTKIPDEIFFVSLNHNPHVLGAPGSFSGLKNQAIIRLKTWTNKPCNGTFVHSVCIFGVGDLKRLAESRYLFANKFHSDFHPYAFDCMEELIYNRTRDGYLGKYVFNPSWYSSEVVSIRKREKS